MGPDLSGMRAHLERLQPGLDTSSMEIVGPLKRVQALLDRGLEPLFASTLVTSPELDTMLKLRFAGGPMIARQVADLLGRSRAAVSKTLNRLERRGMITREVNAADRRSAVVRLTSEGERVVDVLFPRQLAIEAELLEGLDDTERAKIVDALATLVRTLER